MRTRAAVLHELHAPWSIEEIELDPPKAGEVLVKLAASGMCHSDEHLVTGDLAGATAEMPIIGGHEGAGVVVEVGEGVTWLEPGDHVVFGFIPACGRCGPCSEGHSNLCDVGGTEFARGMQISDGTARHHTLDGKDLTLMCLLGTFAEHTVVNEASCVKIEKDWPLDKACLLGCGVVAGWGSAVYAADIKPGDFVAVVGCERRCCCSCCCSCCCCCYCCCCCCSCCLSAVVVDVVVFSFRDHIFCCRCIGV